MLEGGRILNGKVLRKEALVPAEVGAEVFESGSLFILEGLASALLGLGKKLKLSFESFMIDLGRGLEMLC